MRHLDEGTLQAWLDRPRSGLDLDEADAVERHLARCEACSERLAALEDSTRRAVSLLGTPASQGAPPFAEIRARAGALEPPSRTRRPWAAAGWAASVAVALGAGWMANDLFRRAPAASDPMPATISTEVGEGAVAEGPVAEGPAAEAALPLAAPGSTDPDAPGGDGAVAESAPPVVPPAAPAVAARRDRAPSAEAPVPDATSTADAAPAPSPARALIADPTGGAAPVVVRGRVTDAGSGRPLESAQVFVPELAKGTLTGPDGRFALDLGPIDRDSSEARAGASALTLQVRLIGFGEANRTLPLSSTDTALPDVRLEATALMLNEIVVSANRLPEPAPPSVAAPTSLAAPSPEAGSTLVAYAAFAAAAWPEVDREEAEAEAGFAPRAVPGLDVVALGVRSFGDVRVVRVVQALDGDERLTLLQTTLPLTLTEVTDDLTVVSTRVDEIWITALAPRPVATLRGWLESLR